MLSGFAADLRKLGPANFLYADGEVLFAHGHRRIQPATGLIAPPGLCLWSCRCTDPDEPIDARGVTISPGFQEMVLLASVPLTGQTWRPLEEGELVAVSAGKLLERDCRHASAEEEDRSRRPEPEADQRQGT